MEKAIEFLEKFTTGDRSDAVSKLTIPPHRPNKESSFYEYLALRGARVNRVQPDFISCSFTVPPRLTDENGNLTTGSIVTFVDVFGNAVLVDVGAPMNVSVDMSISYLSPAKIFDELEITSRRLGKQGPYAGSSVLIHNKTTGEVVAEGRHSMFSRPASKL